MEEHGNKIILSTESSLKTEHKEIDTDRYDIMLPRCIYALYKQGADEIKLNFSNKSILKTIQDSLGKETVGYEIIDQRENYCVIKNVSGNLEDFDSILRRTFLILINMANESLEYIKKQDFHHLKNVAFLEESNNRFTTTCRRLLNKKGSNEYLYVGPIYYIIEEIENIADYYKYLCNYLCKINNNKIKIDSEVLLIYERINNMMNIFYDIFYKFDEKKIVNMANERKLIVEKGMNLYNKKMDNVNYIVLHYQMAIMQKIFCLIGPYLVLKL